MNNAEHNSRFMLIQGGSPYSNQITSWVIISSSDKVARITKADDLNYIISKGTVRPNNFGHYDPNVTSGAPEYQVLQLRGKLEHHGYFRTLRDLRDYIKMYEVLDV